MSFWRDTWAKSIGNPADFQQLGGPVLCFRLKPRVVTQQVPPLNHSQAMASSDSMKVGSSRCAHLIFFFAKMLDCEFYIVCHVWYGIAEQSGSCFLLSSFMITLSMINANDSLLDAKTDSPDGRNSASLGRSKTLYGRNWLARFMDHQQYEPVTWSLLRSFFHVFHVFTVPKPPTNHRFFQVFSARPSQGSGEWQGDRDGATIHRENGGTLQMGTLGNLNNQPHLHLI